MPRVVFAVALTFASTFSTAWFVTSNEVLADKIIATVGQSLTLFG